MNDKAQGMINANIPVLDKVVIPGKGLPATPTEAEQPGASAEAEAKAQAPSTTPAPAETEPAPQAADVLLTEEAKDTPQAPSFFGVAGKAASESTQEIAIDINARQAVDTAVDQVLEKLIPKIETLTRDALRAAVHDILVEQKNKSQ